LPLVLALALAYLIVCVLPSIRPFWFTSVQSNALRSIMAEAAASKPLLKDVAINVLVAVALHFLLGLAALALTWLSEAARWTRPSQRIGACFLWFVLLASTVTFLSSLWYPNTHGGDYYGEVVNLQFQGIRFGDVWVVAAGLLVGAVAATALWRSGPAGHRRVRSARLIVLAGALGAAAILLAPFPVARTAAKVDRPHVVLIGIDSLRVDDALQMVRDGELPNLARALEGAARIEDATTPLARTFPAWISILTGRAPGDSGVVCNLTPRERVEESPALPELFRERGYRTVLATDEVRFSNIDQSYGFDQLVAPQIGAADFLVAQFSDVPLLNILANTALGEWALPLVHANRAVAYSYEPGSFVERLARNVRPDRSTFIAIHLTTPHWPYVTARSRVASRDLPPEARMFAEYRASLHDVDEQLGQIYVWMQESGILDDALVVLLSDHGEALFQPGDSLLEGVADEEFADVLVARYGHGSSVLSPAQFQVLLAFKGFGGSRERVAGGVHALPATLEDIAPTVLGVLDYDVPGELFTGLSLAPVLRGDRTAEEFADRIRFTETGFNTPQMLAGKPDPRLIAMQGAGHYHINDANGYLELKASSLEQVEAFKERAAMRGPWILAVLPPVAEGSERYVLARRDGTFARLVTSPDEHPELPVLWRALQARYGGFMGRFGSQPDRIASK
jgi:hypothetical protein